MTTKSIEQWTQEIQSADGNDLLWITQHLLLEYKHCRIALNELLEEIDALDDIKMSRDQEPYKAWAVWEDVLDRAREAAK